MVSKLSEKRRAQISKWQEVNRDKVREIQRKSKRRHYEANKEQLKERRKKWGAENRQKLREINKSYRERHKERLRKYRRVYVAQNREKLREYDRQRWLRERAEQDRLATRPRPDHCEICGTKGPVVWDHCHKTGLFRGWLCSKCNRFLGWLDETTDRLQQVIDYLERFKRENSL